MLWLLGALGALAVGSAVTDLKPDEDESQTADGGSDDGLPEDGQADVLAGPCLIDASLGAPVDPIHDLSEDQAPITPEVATKNSSDDYDLVTGTNEADTLIADYNSAFLTGRGGDDLLIGAVGDDDIVGGLGNDTGLGGAGDDTIRGEGGDDSLSGGTGEDEIFGAEGADTLFGGDGADSLAGGDGDDSLIGGDGDDTLHGVQGDDSLSGGAGEDVLFGGRGADTLCGVEEEGEAERDFLNGGDGDDQVIAGAGDVVTSGSGADTVILDFLDARGNEPVFITDFTTAEDTLVISYEDTDGTAPDLKIETDEDNDSFFRVLLDDVLVAEVLSDAPLAPDHVSLQQVSGA